MIIAFLSSSSELGGAERSLLDLIASLRDAEPDWHLHVVLPAAGPLESAAVALGARTVIVELPVAMARLGDHGTGKGGAQTWRQSGGIARHLSALGSAFRYLHRLRGELRRIRPDLIHTNGLKMHVLGARAGAAHVPVVWHLRDFVSTRRVIASALRLNRRRCAAAITNSDAVSDDVRALLKGVPLHRVYNGIDLERFAPTGPTLDLDIASGLPEAPVGTVRVGLVATFARWKGHATFMQALALLPRGSRIRGYIVGGPLYATEGSQHSLEDLTRIAAACGLSGAIGFVGHVSEPAAAMRALDIVVHASTSPEPFGRVIVEAMACGRAVLAADGGGASEILGDIPESRYPPGDAAALAHCIADFAESPRTRMALGEAGRAAAKLRYDRRRLARDVVPIYESLLPIRRVHAAR